MEPSVSVDTLTIGDVLTWIKDGGTLAVLILIIWWGQTGKYLWRWQHDEQLEAERLRAAEYAKDAAEWKNLAIQLLRTNQTAIATSSTLTNLAKTAREGQT